MAVVNMAARFARMSRNLLVRHPDVPEFDECPDPEIARIEWTIARLPKRTRVVFLMHRFEDLRYDPVSYTHLTLPTSDLV